MGTAGLARRRLHRHALELEEAAVMSRGLAAPQLANHRDAFVQPGAALGDRDAAGFELLVEFAAHADPEDEPALREMIEGRNLLGHRRGMAQRHQDDARAEDPPPAHRRSLGELQQRIEDGDMEGEMVVNPQGIVAAALDQLDQEPVEFNRYGEAVEDCLDTHPEYNVG